MPKAELAGPIIDATSIANRTSVTDTASDAPAPVDEGKVDFIDEDRGVEILNKCFKDGNIESVKERFTWMIRNPMRPDTNDKTALAIHPLLFSLLIFGAAAIAVFVYFFLKQP
jgi:hypothetical protein